MSEKEKINNKGAGQVIQAETFRDSIGTMESSGKRKWVYAKKPKGKFTNYRDLVTAILLIVFFGVPFVKINGNPLLKINILDREFFIFGQPFYPQDFFILAMGAIASIVFLILFTVVYGRIFCGWICPQTIFMEGVFRRIEFWIEGDRNKQIKLDQQPWNAEKIRKKTLKWILFVLISILITHMMFMYIVGYEQVFKIMREGIIAHPTNFIVAFIFTGAFLFVFSWFREQVCTLVCPYGRLQGVLIDKKTINVFYDYKRGEGRGKWRKGEDRKAVGKGDCIDCNQCVVVCPTGIDIRNGQQLECINCTACIDACNEVMVKTGLPKGLIRYATEDEIEKQEKFKFTNRMKAYAIVLFGLLCFLAFLIYNRGSMEAKFIKPAGSTYFVKEGEITNTYNYTFLNKSNENKTVTIKVIEPKNGKITFSGSNKIVLKRDNLIKGTVNVSFPEKEIKLAKQNIVIGVFDQSGQLLDTFETTFEGPFKLRF